MPPRRLPFEFQLDKGDARTTAWGGLPIVAEALDEFGATSAVEKGVGAKGRRKFSPADMVKSLVLMMAAGGDCFDDVRILRSDDALQKLLDMEIPAAETLRQFLYEFHDSIEVERAARETLEAGDKAYVPAENEKLRGLGLAVRALVEAAQKRNPVKEATIDIDATIQESHKREAKAHYLDGRGYQPMVAIWAEQDVVVADEFRDGNVPATFDSLGVIQRAFAALPDYGIERRFLRADTQAYTNAVLRWLIDQSIEFAIGAQKRADFIAACETNERWQPVETRPDTQLDVAEINYVSREMTPYRGRFRYLAIRMTPRQGELLESGERRVVYLSIVTNRPGDPVDVLRWYWAKAGTIERTHDIIKNELGGGVLPCGRFGANAAWFRIAVMTYNVLSIMRRIGPEELRDARPKRLRFQMLALPTTVARHARRLWAHVCARLAAANFAVSMRRALTA